MNRDEFEQQLRGSFEASLPLRLARSSRVELQSVIPSHWFSAAASECHSMFIAGHFYGAISVAQAYVESLARFLYEVYGIRGNPKNPGKQWEKLAVEKLVGSVASDAAQRVLSKRNDFHHLNKEVEQDYAALEKRAEECINLLNAIEVDVFAHSFDRGKLVLARPERWPSAGGGLTSAYLRQKW